VQLGWDAFFHEDTIHTNWAETHPDIGSGDPNYIAEQARHNEAINAIRLEHPAWGPAYDTFSVSGSDPVVWKEVRHLVKDPMFTKTDVGQGLVAYVALYDKVNAELGAANVTTLNSAVATNLGYVAEYEQGVNQIVAEHPDFGTAYRVFFKNDLRAGVTTAGQTTLEGIAKADPAFIEGSLYPWWSQFEKLKAAPDQVPIGGDTSGAFEAIRSYVNGAYDTFDDAHNPMLLWWGGKNAADKQTYLASLVGRPYQYATRFDKQTLLGETTTPVTEQRWTAYEQARAEISARNLADPNFSSTAAYKALDAWVLAQAQTDPTFAAQVRNANTLGFSFAQLRTQLFPTSPQLDADWGAFLDGVHQIQDIVERYGLNGSTAGFDPHKKAAYLSLQTSLQHYADQLAAQDQAFGAQFAQLEKWSGTDTAIARYFVPNVYYPIGSSAMVNP